MKKIILISFLLISSLFSNNLEFHKKFNEIKELMNDENLTKSFTETKSKEKYHEDKFNKILSKFKYFKENNLLLDRNKIDFDKKLNVLTKLDKKTLINGIFYKEDFKNYPSYEIISEGLPIVKFSYVTTRIDFKIITIKNPFILKDKNDFDVKITFEKETRNNDTNTYLFFNNKNTKDYNIMKWNSINGINSYNTNNKTIFYVDKLPYLIIDSKFDENKKLISKKLIAKYKNFSPFLEYEFDTKKNKYVSDFKIFDKNGNVVFSFNLKNKNNLKVESNFTNKKYFKIFNKNNNIKLLSNLLTDKEYGKINYSYDKYHYTFKKLLNSI